MIYLAKKVLLFPVEKNAGLGDKPIPHICTSSSKLFQKIIAIVEASEIYLGVILKSFIYSLNSILHYVQIN